jgi:hypothetical protein
VLVAYRHSEDSTMKLSTQLPELEALSNLPDDALIAVDSVAALYSCSTRHAWRAADRGLIPRPLHVGHIVRWRIGTIREHIRAGCPSVRKGARE